MADGVFTALVVTPERELLAAPAREVIARSSEGFLTVLDGHTPLVSDVVPGEVRVELEDATVVHLAVHGGYLQVETGPGVGSEDAPGGNPTGRATRATVLAGVAELAADIDVARAELARAAAEARAQELRAATGRNAGEAASGTEHQLSPEEVELLEVEAALLRAEVRLQVAGVLTAS
jgi:F-type H+-transporting ATPase subunit epsilon